MDDTDTTRLHRNNAVTWTNGLTERLRQLHDEKLLSGSQIAVVLSKEFDVKLDRNAICGKKWRMGLRGNGSGSRPGARPKLVKKDKKVVRQRDIEPVAKPLPPPPTPQSDWDIPLEQRRTFWELTANTCRWPVGEGAEMFYCGAEPLPDMPYCRAHCRRAYTFMPRAA